YKKASAAPMPLLAPVIKTRWVNALPLLLRQRGVQVLQGIDLQPAALAQILQTLDGRACAGYGGEERNTGSQGVRANGTRVGNGVAPLFYRVNHHGDFAVLDHVHNVRAT